jgi:DNA polymerase III delta prime subunit
MHHAYLYEGPFSLLPALAHSARDLFDMKHEGDPDVHMLSWEKFGIDESRELTAQASFKSMSSRALFIIGVSSITSDAQQALLKLFEEPQAGVTFVLLAPHGSIIPTLRSRFLNYPLTLTEEQAQHTVAKKFLASAYKERSTQITALLKDEELNKERVRDFLQSLESLLYKKVSDAEYRSGLSDIALVRNYAGDRSAALKMLLEHLASTLPTV